MQWNIHRELGLTASNSTPQAAAIARIVNYNQPDVLLFNEVIKDTVANNQAALTAWVTNNLPYMGTQPGVTFFVAVSTVDDFFIRNAAISRYPILSERSDDDGLRGLHWARLQLSGTNELQTFHAHFKCCSDMQSDCNTRQANAVFASDKIRLWAATNSTPYIFAGDWNEDESNPQCTLTSTYRPITMVRTNGNLVEFLSTALNGVSNTISSTNPQRRFDYCLAGSNRLSAVSGYVFNSSVWGSQYTSVIPGSSTSDSITASDHLCVQVTYSFPTSVTNFSITPTNAFTSSGNQAGPFSPPSQVYTLTNSDTIPLFWSVTKTSSWLTVSTLATNLTLGAGQSTNITAFITNSVANSLLPGTYVDTINFSNTATGVSISRSVSLTVIALPPPVANFTGSPTNGVEPLAVTFTDTSTGNITNRFWDFGDSNTTNVTTNSVAHTYAGGTYTVTLVVTGLGGVSTNTQANYLIVLPASTILADAGNLFDSTTNNLAPTNSVAVLVVDTGNNGFADPQPSFLLSLGATWGTDDRVVGLWDLTACNCGDGQLFDQTVVAYTSGIAAGQKLQLYWFPSLTLASTNTPLGVTYYGKYTDQVGIDGSDVWQMPAGGTNVYLKFWTEFWGGSNPETTGLATNLTTGLTAFQSWQIQYFGDTNNAAAASSADPDGDSMINANEFLAGFNPTNSAAYLHVISVAKTAGTNITVTYLGANGDSTGSPGIASRTNMLEFTTGGPGGNYSNNFASANQTNVLSGGSGLGGVSSFIDTNGATGAARYYRIRVLAP